MSRIPAINPDQATGPAQELLRGVENTLGFVPNTIRTMANSPAVLEGYLEFSKSLSKGRLPSKLREQIALTVAEVNGCRYCLAAHSAIGKTIGLSEEAIEDSRQSISPDSQTAAVLQFARALVIERGMVSNADLAHIHGAGFSDGDIAEIIATVSLSLFTNYLNHVAQTKLDFPEVTELQAY
ncbi:MAG: carboxymuconolactone decarboxylase family protein [Nitrospirales bacterium]